MYDAIIIGARVAGSPTAMLLARKGYRVLLLDRASFPSDTLSTHQLHLPASLALKRWGLLDKVLATHPGSAHHVLFDIGETRLEGMFPTVDGVSAVHSPRRTILDKILVDAAVEAGAELREGFITDEIIREGDHFVGVRGRTANGPSVTERARIVIGADGRHSLVARTVNAPVYDQHPVLTCGYYSYWENVPLNGGEMYRRGPRIIGAWPTNDHLTMIYVAWPAAEFDRFRADVEGNYRATIDLVPGLAERIRDGKRVERISGAGDIPNFYRKPYGPGWALVGDAGYLKDPVTGMGISDAFRDAELLANAVHAAASGTAPEKALGDYEQKRNAASKPYYDLTIDSARMNPFGPEHVALMRALSNDPALTQKFFGVLTGVLHPGEVFSPQKVFQLVGVRGMAKLVWSRLFPQAAPG
ncbi:MAG: NAD(P)/FAD-dependent oxidoreductase [Anaerolineae bacterium]|nr:NAD(P)/FAD-dependent oxidoreductase [Anaerolineae bacterium]